MQAVSDILSNTPPKVGAPTAPRNKKLQEVTHELVGSVFYGTLLKTMRASEMKGKYGHGGRGEEVFGAQLDQALAEQTGKATRGGVADAIYQRLAGQQNRMDGVFQPLPIDGKK